MIPKHIEKKAGTPDNFIRLGEYIAAAKETGEKLDKLWIVNCNAGSEPEDLKTALYEIEATRKLKPNVADKTYHLVVSFRPGDREKLSGEDLKAIEREFAEALGFSEHQRVAGTHINTDNFHMHVAFNKVHPKTLLMHTPFQDFPAMERAARKLEKRFGLAVDLGMSDAKGQKISPKARNLEAKTWQQSFESHLRENKPEILAAIDGATTWSEVHKALADYGTGLKRHGAGLVFYHREGHKAEAMKASSLDRSCSLKALQDRLGPYEPAPSQEQAANRPPPPEPRRPYIARPLIRHPGQDKLWQMFRQEKKAPGFIARNFLNLRSWRDYLLADAHKDPLAMAIIVTYRELLHGLEGSPAPHTHAPKSIVPALRRWFHELPWETPDTPALHPDFVSGAGLKIDGDDRLVFPLRDREGRTWALRAVDAQGRSCDMGDMKAPEGLRHVLDTNKLLQGVDRVWRGPIIIATDLATATTMHKAIGTPVVVAGREKDLVPIAHELAARYRESQVLVVSAKYPKSAQKAAKAIGGKIATPQAAIAKVASWSADISASQGHVVSVDKATAAAMGAFEDDALVLDAAVSARPVSPALADRDQTRRQQTADRAGEAASIGHVATVDRRTAATMGAFEDEALSNDDVLAARQQSGMPVNRGAEGAEKALEVASKGRVVSVERRLAESLGAFSEDALSPEDALASAKRPALTKPGTETALEKSAETKPRKVRKHQPGIEL